MKHKAKIVFAASLLAISTQASQAAGCLKGAVVGGVAGHFAHHPVVGAAVGCAIGHHRAAVQRREMEQRGKEQDYQNNRGGQQDRNR